MDFVFNRGQKKLFWILVKKKQSFRLENDSSLNNLDWPKNPRYSTEIQIFFFFLMLKNTTTTTTF